MEELRKILEEIGMSSYKIETYLSLLKIKTGTIQQIAKISKVPSCKLYENLKWLYENGYITLILQKPLTYKVNDPNIILKSEINKREEKLEGIKKELSEINLDFPEFEKDLIQITNSKEAFIKKMKESLEKSKKSVSYIAQNWKMDSELWRLLKTKKEKGVKIRALGPINGQEKLKWIRETKIEIKNYEPKTTRFSIFDKELVIIRLRKNEDSEYYSIWIKNEVLAEILENYFNMLWNSH